MCGFMFVPLLALSRVRFHLTRTWLTRRVAAGYTHGPGSCDPSNHLPYRWFARKSRRTLVKSPDPSATKQRTGKHDLRQSLVRPCHPPRVAAPRGATFATRVGPLDTRNPSPRCPTDSPFPIGIRSKLINLPEQIREVRGADRLISWWDPINGCP